ncbi:MAG: hypothetical protein NT151_11840 [Acidobacteria bacterium]|nr:hypothetical protein [Acidobacteriota bacterium]
MAWRGKPYHEATVQLDAETVDVHIRRQTIHESTEFREAFARLWTGDAPKPEDPAALATFKREQTAFLIATIERDVTFGPGQVFVGEREILSGSDILEVFGDRLFLLGQLLGLAWRETVMGDLAKNVLSSGRSSAPGSPASTSAASGDASATIAEPVEPLDSTASAAAIDPTGTIQ